MNSFYDFDDIQDYLQGRMSDVDRKAFEAAMADNEDLSTQVEALRAEETILLHLRREALLDRLNELGANADAKAGKQGNILKLRYRHLAWIAAAALILLFWALTQYGGIFSPNPEAPEMADQPAPLDKEKREIRDTGVKDAGGLASKTDTQTSPILSPGPSPKPDPRYWNIAQRNFKTSNISINLMGENDSNRIKDTLQMAAFAIEQKRYDDAQKLLKKVPVSPSDNYTSAQILLGDIYFLLNKFDQAEKAYAAGAQSTKDKFRDEAQWQLLLTYLSRYPSRKSDFEQLLSTILSEPEHTFFDKARSIEAEINGLIK